MKLVLLIGNSAVGKMTVGQELMKLTGLRLFHNHMMIEPVLEIFGQWRPDVTQRLRQVIFEEFAKTDLYGMIFTFMWAFDMQSDWDYIDWVKGIFGLPEEDVYYVELIAPGGPAPAQRHRQPSEAQGLQAEHRRFQRPPDPGR